MKKFIFSLGTIATMMVVSCSGHDEPGFPPTPERPGEEEVQAPDFGRPISEEEAATAAIDALVNFYDGIGSRADEFSVEIVSKGDKDTALYVVSLAQGGYAIVDPDENAPFRVLGMSDNGTCPSIAKAYGLQVKASYTTDAAPGTTLPKPSQSLASDVDTIMNVWATPLWGEGAPYNKYCKTKDGAQSNAGTMAVAMAAVMAYNKYPTAIGSLSIDWSKIWPNASSGADDTIARLLAQIGKDTDINYEPGLANFDAADILPAMKNYGYRAARETTDVDELFNQTGPSIGYAMSYDKKLCCWVVDGNMITTGVNKSIEYPDDIIITKYLRFNWCMEGSGNGWFLADGTWKITVNGKVVTIQTQNNVPGYVVSIYKP